MASLDRSAEDAKARIRDAVRLLYGEGQVGNADDWRTAAQRLEPLLDEIVPDETTEPELFR